MNLHFDSLELFLDSLNFNFGIIGLSETRILSKSSFFPTLEGYQSYITPTEANHGGTLLFVSENFDSVRRSDLEPMMYSSKLLESTFAEIQLKNKPNIVVGTIYRHHSLSPTEFTNNFFLYVLEKVNRQGKFLVLLGDFNIDLIKSTDPHNN